MRGFERKTDLEAALGLLRACVQPLEEERVSPREALGRTLAGDVDSTEDVRKGDRVLERGRVLRPHDLGVLASIRRTEVAATRRPVVGILTTGREDHLPLLLAEAGEILVHGVNIRPESPVGFGSIGGTLAVLLPGNPVAAMGGFDVFACPALQLQLG